MTTNNFIYSPKAPPRLATRIADTSDLVGALWTSKSEIVGGTVTRSADGASLTFSAPNAGTSRAFISESFTAVANTYYAIGFDVVSATSGYDQGDNFVNVATGTIATGENLPVGSLIAAVGNRYGMVFSFAAGSVSIRIGLGASSGVTNAGIVVIKNFTIYKLGNLSFTPLPATDVNLHTATVPGWVNGVIPLANYDANTIAGTAHSTNGVVISGSGAAIPNIAPWSVGACLGDSYFNDTDIPSQLLAVTDVSAVYAFGTSGLAVVNYDWNTFLTNATSTLGQVIPKWCLVGTFTNDAFQGGAIPATTSLSQSIAVMKSIAAAIVAKGMLPVFTTPGPTDTAAGITQGKKDATRALRLGIIDFCSANNYPCLDIWSILGQTTPGTMDAGLDSGDHTHPSLTGFNLLANKTMALVKSAFCQ